MKLCVVMPALNEAATISDVIGRIPDHIPGVDETAVVVVDDGSSDSTRTLALEAGATVVSHLRVRGVGAAFQTGVREALRLRADIMVHMDSDGQFDPAHIPRLIEPLVSGRAEFVTASRFKDRSLVPEMTLVKYWGNIGMSLLVSVLARKRLYDVSCGFRAFTQDALRQMNLHGNFTYTQETILELAYKGVHVEEVPLPVRGTRQHGKSRVASNIFHYGFKTSKIIFRSFRDYNPMLVFDSIAFVLFAVGMGLGIFLLIHWRNTGAFSPHKWAGFAAAFLSGMAFLVFVTGMVAGMLARVRLNQERILYLLKGLVTPEHIEEAMLARRRRYDTEHDGDGAANRRRQRDDAAGDPPKGGDE